MSNSQDLKEEDKMDDKMIDLQNLSILCGSYKTAENENDHRGMNKDTFDIVLKEYAREVDRVSDFNSHINTGVSRFNKIQWYDITLNIESL